MPEELKHLSLRVHPQMKDTIRELAEREGVPRAEYARYLLKIGIDARTKAIRKTKPFSQVNNDNAI